MEAIAASNKKLTFQTEISEYFQVDASEATLPPGHGAGCETMGSEDAGLLSRIAVWGPEKHC